MAKSMIDEVRNAEKKASEIIADAQSRSTDGTKAAVEKAQEIVQSTVKNAKKRAAVMISTAENNAYKQKTKAVAENTEFAKQSVEACRANTEKAVCAIISEIIPE